MNCTPPDPTRLHIVRHPAARAGVRHFAVRPAVAVPAALAVGCGATAAVPWFAKALALPPLADTVRETVALPSVYAAAPMVTVPEPSSLLILASLLILVGLLMLATGLVVFLRLVLGNRR